MTADPRRLTEIQLHMHVAALLRKAAAPGVIWFHVPNGELRDKATAHKLTQMGVLPGVPDLVIMVLGRSLAFLELKGDGGKLSPEQRDFMDQAAAMGCGCGWARTPEQALALLVEWGAVRTSSGSIHSIGRARSKAEGA